MTYTERTRDLKWKLETSEKPYGANGFEKRWFCTAICQDGSIFLDDADSPARFLELIPATVIAWLDFRTSSSDFARDAQLAATQLGFSDQLVSSLSGESRLLYEDFNTELGMRLPSIQIRAYEHPDVQPHTTLLFLRKNFILSIHTFEVDRRFSRLRRYSNRILRNIPIEACTEDKLTLLLTRIIDQNNDRNFEHLRQIEEQGDELNKKMMNSETPREILGPQIYGMKHALITYLNALWETVDVLHDVRYGDAEILSNNQKLLERVGLLAEDVNRQIALAEHMSEVLASGLEVLQSIYNNQLQVLNNRMSLVITYLTVIGTAVLVPNTIATIFSNSAFSMTPRDIGWYIALLVGSTVGATTLVFWWVKRLGWVPRKMD